MPNQPALKPRRVHFRMELESKRTIAKGKCLIVCEFGGREALCPLRQIKRIAMPVKDRRRVQMLQVGRSTGWCQLDRSPGNLFRRARIDARPQGSRDKLCPKTN